MQERQTKQKQIIYEALRALNHPTATEVYGYVREIQPSVSRATVFRVLGSFAACGRAQELRFAGAEVRYDYRIHPHYHARCLSCGTVADVPSEEPMDNPPITPPEDFCLKGYSVEIFGYCKHCQV